MFDVRFHEAVDAGFRRDETLRPHVFFQGALAFVRESSSMLFKVLAKCTATLTIATLFRCARAALSAAKSHFWIHSAGAAGLGGRCGRAVPRVFTVCPGSSRSGLVSAVPEASGGLVRLEGLTPYTTSEPMDLAASAPDLLKVSKWRIHAMIWFGVWIRSSGRSHNCVSIS